MARQSQERISVTTEGISLAKILLDGVLVCNGNGVTDSGRLPVTIDSFYNLGMQVTLLPCV